jgi:formaldehyde-activating enzyme involved in methanogenesis
MNELTYKQLTDQLVKIASAHYNVAHSDAGVLENLNYGGVEYPLVFFINQSVEITPNEANYNMIMLVANFVDNNLLQQTMVQSNMLEITKDIISYLLNGNYDADWILDDTSIVSTPFVDNLPDLTAGYQTNFRIRLPFDNSGCDLAFDPSKL